jgi:Ca2+-binding RTX toxin-like protein
MANIVGTNSGETLTGTAGDDTIQGLGGDDTLIGGAGADVLDGGTGNDDASYSNASSAVIADLLNPMNNTGDAAGDTYISIENLFGSAFNDQLVGNANTTSLVGGAGADILDGTAGITAAGYYTASAGVTANLANSGLNTGDAAGDTYISIESLIGSGFADTLVGDSGNNFLRGGGGADVLDGGAGVDTADYLFASNGITASLGNPASNTGEASGDTYTSIENLRGGNFNDSLTGNGGNNRLTGGEGNDTLNGGNGTTTGNDILDGGGGSDLARYSSNTNITAGITVVLGTASGPTTANGTVTGDAVVGTDTLISIERIQGTNFADTMTVNSNFSASNGAVVEFEGNGGNDTFVGNGSTRVGYSQALAGVTVNLLAGTAQSTLANDAAGVGVDSFAGTIGPDKINAVNGVRGSNFADVISAAGARGSFDFIGLGGNDTFIGTTEAINNFDNNEARYDIGTTNAINVHMGSTSTVTDLGGSSVGTDTLINIERVRGTDFDDVFTADADFNGPYGNLNCFEGNGGNDTINGNGHTQLRYAATAVAAITVDLQTGHAFATAGGDAAGIGLDTFTGVNNVVGSDFNDTLLGTDSADPESFGGGAGDDFIDGRGGLLDRATYEANPAGIDANLATGVVHDGYGGTDTLVNIEGVGGSEFNDVIVGDGNANRLAGQGGDDQISGGGGDDIIQGDEGPNLYGGAFGGVGTLFDHGNDLLNGGAGNDTIGGGRGIDTAVFSGPRATSTITALANGDVQVVGPDGTDTLTSIERLKFSNVTLTKQDADFSGDFQSDLLWRHNDGTLFAWLMNNGQRATDVDLSKIPTQWHIEDTGDFNGDGSGDLLWRNDDGTTYLWLMHAGQRNADVNLGVIPNSFHIQGTGDLDGDGDSDILWRHNDGTTLAWLMQDGQRVADVSYGTIPTSFHIQSIGDLDGDGDADILWRHNDGTTLSWLMQNGQRVQDVSYGTIPTSFHIQATGDLDADGDADILWRHNDGTTLAWLMQNGQRVQDVSYGTIPTSFQVQGTGDINGDGSSDIIWRHNDGTTLAWLMVNGQRASDVSLGTIPTAWTIQEHHFDIV